MKKIYQHVLHIKPDQDKPVECDTLEYDCSNFDSTTAKNFVVQMPGEREKRHLDRDRLGVVSSSRSGINYFYFSVYFVDDAEGHKNVLRETAQKVIDDHLTFMREKLEELEVIKLDF